MNERIKELYSQAGGLVGMYEGKLTYFPAYQKNLGDGNFKFSSFDAENFAELIVRECLGIVKSNIRGPVCSFDYSYSAEDAATDERAENIYQEIKEHFGVKE